MSSEASVVTGAVKRYLAAIEDLRIRPSLARFSTVSICLHGHPRLLPLAGTDTSNSPNCDGQAVGLHRGVPLTRPLFHPCTKILLCLNSCAPGRRYSITPFRKFPDLPGIENRAHFSYA